MSMQRQALPFAKSLPIRVGILMCHVLLVFMPKATEAQILTVTGPIDADRMGLTLIHEHVMVDWIGADSTGNDRWDKNEVVARAQPFLEELKRHDVATFIDCTPAYLGRDPEVLRELANLTGLHILTNTGYYGALDEKFIPGFAFGESAEALSERWIAEFKDGIDGTGIRPGFLKISVGQDSVLSPLHQKLVRAAALTHLETGMAIVSHTGPDAPAMAQLALLDELGVAPEAFVWTHAQGGTFAGYLRAAKMGAWISLDHVNAQPTKDGTQGNVEWYTTMLGQLKRHKVLDHVLLSHDAGWYDVGVENGGSYRGYTDLFTALLPALRELGFTQDDFDLLLIENPRKAYALQVRKTKY